MSSPPIPAPGEEGLGYRIRSLLERWARERGLSPGDGLRYWQERSLDALLLAGVVLGLATWLPSVLLSLAEDRYGIALVDTLLLLIVIVLLLRRDWPYLVRSTGLVVISFVVGLVLLLALGPFSGGPVWLFIPPILSGVLGGPKASVAALFVNALTLIAIAILVQVGAIAVPMVENLQARWLVCSVNFLLLDALAAVGVALIVQGLQTALEEEFQTRESLREKHVLLRATNERLAAEIAHREQAEEQLRDHRDHLEVVVAERTADLKARGEEMKAFAYSISHDLRNPLRTIAGFGEILLEEHTTTLDETARGYLERMRAGAKKMDGLIDGMLGLSRSSQTAMHCETLDLGSLAAGIVNELRRREPARPVDVTIVPSLLAWGDRVLVTSVLENLLGNAWKFTGRRERASIEVGGSDADGTICFVRDNGPGFNMKHAAKLFSAFQRLHDDEFPGTGIGLAIVQRIVERHGGRVWAEAAPDKGASFYFWLPTRAGGLQQA